MGTFNMFSWRKMKNIYYMTALLSGAVGHCMNEDFSEHFHFYLEPCHKKLGLRGICEQ